MPEKRFLRVNVGQQEAFTAELGIDAATRVRVLTADRVSWWRSEPMPYQVACYANELPAIKLERWLARDKNLLAVRRLAIRLMRHTQALNSANHCPQAVRSVGGPPSG